MRRVAALAASVVAAVLVLSAPATGQPTSLCAPDDMCKLLGGQCRTGLGTANFDCEKKFLDTVLCGTTKLCQCCIPRQVDVCPEDKVCSRFRGKCVQRKDCKGKWEPGLCCDGHPFLPTKERCGCCVEESCKPLKQCSINDGTCTEKADCNPETHIWEKKWCEGQTDNKPCGCCVKRPGCLPTPQKCEEKGGKCVKRDLCPDDHIWRPRMCKNSALHVNEDKCGCCIPPPAKCEPLGGCTARGGDCRPKGKCQNGFTWDITLCVKSDGSFDPNCGCCYPDQPPPTCVDPQESCEAAVPVDPASGFKGDARCIPESACPTGNTGIAWVAALCDPNADPDNCGCCLRGTRCDQTNTCKAVGGWCTALPSGSPNEKCPKGYAPDASLCDGQECFCCRPITCEPLQDCKDKGGHCLPKADCPVNNGFVWDEKLCIRTDGTVDPDCGCCYPETPPPECPLFQDKCKQAVPPNGDARCLVESDCPTQNPGVVWVPELCDPNTDPDACGCCLRGVECDQTDTCTNLNGWCTVGIPGVPTCPSGYFADPDLCFGKDCSCCRPITCQPLSDCSDKGGKCTPKADCPVNNGYAWDEKLCVRSDGTLDPDCGCCYPESDPPCDQSFECKQATPFNGNARCLKEADCPAEAAWVPQLCDPNADPTTDPDNCGCCIRGDCEQTDQCRNRDGWCTTGNSATACPSGYFADPDLCDGPGDCFCCRPVEPVCEVEQDACRQATPVDADGNALGAARCVPKDDCPLSQDGFAWVARLCDPNDPDSDDCGCCIRGTQCSQDDKCASNGGWCSVSPTCPNGYYADPDACSGGSCTCCFPEN